MLREEKKQRYTKMAAALLKKVWSVVKSHTDVLKDKSAAVIKTKAVLLGLLKNKKMLRAISHRMRTVFHSHEDEESNSMALTVYQPSSCEEKYEPEIDYLTHTLFDSDDNPRNSVALILDGRISTSMDAKQLEEEIDGLADVFIRRFHAQMRMQKSDSFKQYEDMLRRSV